MGRVEQLVSQAGYRGARSLPTAPVAAGSLIAGYAVAVGSGSRPLGGVVLLAGGLACGRAWWQTVGAARAGALGGVYVAAFIGSHLLARPIGAWPAVLSVSAVTAAAAYVVSDRADRAAAR